MRPFRLSRFPGRLYLTEGLLDEGPGGGHVHAHEAAALRPEGAAVVEPHTGFVGHEAEQFFVFHAQAAQVEPQEVGAFGNVCLDLRKTLSEKPEGELHVGVHVLEHLVEPLLPVVVGCDECRRTEDVALFDMVAAQFRPQRLPSRRIGGDRGRGGESRDVEGFGGSDQGDALLSFGAQGPDVGVAAGSEYQVGVDFVAHDVDSVFAAQGGYPGQFLRGEYASGGIVGVAEQEYRRLFQFAVEVVEVNAVVSRFGNEGVLHHPSVVGFYLGGERRIDRRHDDDPVAGGREGPQGEDETGYHARCEIEPAAVDIPTVATFYPAHDRAVVGFAAHAVSEYAVSGAAGDGIADEVGGLEVHVGYPQRDNVGIAESRSVVVFDASAPAAVYDVVEVVFHSRFIVNKSDRET